MVSTFLPVELFKAARLSAGTDIPGENAHPAQRLAWLIEQPDAFRRHVEIGACLMGIDSLPRQRLAAACEGKLFPNANSRTGMNADKIATLRMLQSIRCGG